ncbi:terminal uridylyltransferase 7 isoform X1 [Coregonus clupeaformis]|uniref:terminal uridylyltransferase 7 isoform X1 n=1 Tax=Coregonus clupeaformis TaxID=59861 RepID=UPI001BE0D16D|nr:terminal uridylyltransferase 7 isoform X1 [Coregonus clupeaformis]XP_045081588.1 terminal uridylyltransferase 7 isoform X1 [Coregonus clupeaformis]
MEESGGRPRYPKQGGRERGAVANEAEAWRNQDAGRGYSPKPERRGQGKRGRPKKGVMGPLSSSPGGGVFKGGQSPSQREGFQRPRYPESQQVEGLVEGREENWRERPSQRWRRTSQGEDPGEDREQGRRDNTDNTPHSSGGRNCRYRDRRRGLGEEDRGPVVDESSLSAKELLGLKQAEEKIGREEIFRLKKRSRSKPSAVYTCSLCEVLLDSVSEAHRHVKDKWHKRRAKERREEAVLTDLAPPGVEQVVAVSVALEGVVRERGMSDQDVENRRQIVSNMQEVLMSVLPEVKLRLYGSSCTKFGFKDSDVNIDIQFPPHMHQPEVLLLVQESLSVSILYGNLEADFHARVPVVICKDEGSGLVCKVSAGNDNACLTTSFLSELANREPLLLPLVLGFRHWARICHVDRAEEGGLPPYVLALMVIYFLQQRKQSILPAYLGHEIKEFSISRLYDFSLTYVEDGFVHWGYYPVSKDSSSSSTPETIYREGKAPLVFQRPVSPPAVGLLWVEMLRFYSLEFNMAECVISVRTSLVLSREAKDWPKKRIAVEDPFAVKRNVARTLNSQQMYEYILHSLKSTYKYFALPLRLPSANHTTAEPRGANHKPGPGHKAPSDVGLVQSGLSGLLLESQATTKQKGEADVQDSDCMEEEEESPPESDQEKEEEDLGKNSLSEEEEEDGVYPRHHLDSVTTEDEELFPLDEVSGEEQLSDEEGPDLDTPGSLDEEDEVAPPTVPEDPPKQEAPDNRTEGASVLCYGFTRQAFTRGRSHTVVCGVCKRDGHLKKDCPEDFQRVQLAPLPPMTPAFLKTLNTVCQQCYRDFALDEVEVGVREHILLDLESFVKRQFTGARLRLFGSSKNGFGFKQSDLDICMVLDGEDTAEGLDCISIIESLARLLRKHPGLRNILPITTAKVPIVKFYHVRTGLEGDISLYNTLALYNTRLLASYAAVDPRVKILCYVMKVLAKMCDIGDASRGSLSSYGYTLMVLFYLQQRNPPVIPVLQEIYDGEAKPEVLVDGWNVYFYDDLDNLPERWQQRNMECVGSLWLGLLQFYTETFDFREHVISIRQRAALTTFNKQWTSKYIVIEDPFDLNHNLGAGLSRRMTNFIMKAFINGRRVFGTPVKTYPPEYTSQMEFFFDPEVLTEGQLAPNDRCCRICGKIGHFMKDCPMRRKSRQCREQEGRRDWAASEGGRERRQGDRWRRQEEKRCCFLCGSNAHIKKDCPQYRGPAGAKAENSSPSTSHMRNLRERERRGSPQQEKKKQQQNVI